VNSSLRGTGNNPLATPGNMIADGDETLIVLPEAPPALADERP
jgi:hypothetical protein